MKNLSGMLAAALAVMLISACGQKTEDPAPAADNVEAPEAAAPADTGGMILPATTENSDARAHYMAGWASFENSRMNDAHSHFLEAAAADPGFAMGHLMAALSAPSTEAFVTNLGLATANKINVSEEEQVLISAFEKALAADSQGLIAALREMTTMYPDSPRAWVFLGNALTNVNNATESRAAYARAMEVDPKHVPAHINLGNNLLTLEPKDFAEAERHFMHAVELTPDEPNPYDLLGDVHRAQGNLEAAYNDYSKAAELAPDLGSALQQRGHVNSFLGNYDEARADYSRSVELENARGATTGGFFLVYRAYVSLHEGDFDAAIAELQGIVDTADEDYAATAADLKVNALTNIALIATEAGNGDVAGAAIDDAAEVLRAQADAVGSDDLRDAAEATIAYMQGMLAARLGDPKGAETAAATFEGNVASSTSPRKLERMHEIQGMTAWYQGDYGAAVEHLSKGDTRGNMHTKYYLARANEEAGNAEEAARLYDELAVYNFNGPGYAMFRKDILARASD
jgi:tetratricopeptide (TPR) repeat protein